MDEKVEQLPLVRIQLYAHPHYSTSTIEFLSYTNWYLRASLLLRPHRLSPHWLRPHRLEKRKARVATLRRGICICDPRGEPYDREPVFREH